MTGGPKKASRSWLLRSFPATHRIGSSARGSVLSIHHEGQCVLSRLGDSAELQFQDRTVKLPLLMLLVEVGVLIP